MSIAIHDFELALLDPCLSMSERGVLIDNDERERMSAALAEEVEPLHAEAFAIVSPRLHEGMPRENLFRDKWTCPCCRGGSKKSQACWNCAGFDKGPNKKQMLECLEKTVGLLEKFDLKNPEQYVLKPCTVCRGEGRREFWSFNPNSDDQLRIVLYDLLKYPVRTREGKPSVDEEKLKYLLAEDKHGIIKPLLTIRKHETMRSQLKRMAPGEDGRLRTFYNPAGTETGRFNSSGGKPYPKGMENYALEVSTNLQNLSKRQVARNPLYNTRRCLVPDEGEVFLCADLSQAEAFIVTALCGNRELLERMLDPTFDIHIWTAAHIFSKPEGDITYDERFLGKKSRHAFGYAEGWARFQSSINIDADITGIAITAAQAKLLHAAYHRLHPELELWWRAVAQRLENTNSITTIFGRRRTFFGRRRGERWLDEVHKEALAQEPQSTVADLLNRGLLRHWNNYDRHLDNPVRVGQLQMQVHDEIVVGCPTAHVGRELRRMRGCLEEELEVGGIRFTIPVELEVGELNWGELKEAA